MKELIIEEKAKAYDEALHKAKRIINVCVDDNTECRSMTACIQQIFPELKENEDEKIRKELIKIVNDHYFLFKEIDRAKTISWLEKQKDMEAKLIISDEGYSKAFQDGIEEALTNPHKYGLEKQDEKKSIDDLTQQEAMDIAVAKCFNEQEPADKVESKFNIEKGKWYVCNTPRYTDFVVGKAYYCPKNGMLKPNENEIARYVAKDCFHLWTILDAKGGDVLIHNKIPFIFMGIENGIVKGICAELSDTILNFGEPEYDNDYLPATKEQHDTLTKAMTDAGYTFDFEKKELKKIKQKTAWSEEDENRFNNLIYLVENSNEGKGTKEGFIKFINRLKDLKDKAQTKQEWGEEDERNLNDAILFIKTGTYSLDKDNLINWLKSLRPQKYVGYNPYKATIESIAKMCDKYECCIQNESEARDFLANVKVKLKDAIKYDEKYPQNTWNLSEGQILAINTAINIVGKSTITGMELIGLLEQLKAL